MNKIKVTDDDILKKRKLRFAENAHPECYVPISKKDSSEVLEKRLMRFSGKVSKPNEDLLNILKKRKDRFGEITSTLLKSIEEKEKVLKRKTRFGQAEGIKQNTETVKKLKVDQKLVNTACEISTNKEIKEKKALKKITFEDAEFLLSK